MRKGEYKNFSLDDRIAIMKQLSKDFFLWDYQTQSALTMVNPVMAIHKDGVITFDNVAQFHAFYAYSQRFVDESGQKP